MHGGWNRIDLALFFRSKFIDLSIIFWVDNIGSLWNKNGRVSNTSDLGAQEMLFFTKEEWVANNVPLKVS